MDTGVAAPSYLAIINDLTYSGIEDKSRIEKIDISFNHFGILVVDFYTIFTFYNIDFNCIPHYTFNLQRNVRTKLTFSSFSVRKLNSIHNKCISDKELEIFGEHYFHFITIDCYFKSLNKSYGCIPLADEPVYIDRDILKNGYKLCNISINKINHRPMKLYYECSKLFKPNCNLNDFNVKFETIKLSSNETILEIIPKKTPNIAFIETYKTDFNRFIYNCGGILGLWFGLTPMKLVDILQYLPQISKTLISQSIKLILYLKAINIRFARNSFAQNVIAICKRLVLFFIANIIIFAYNLIAIFTRFAQMSFGICKRFVFYSFGIGVRFAQNVIAICRRLVLFFIANMIIFAYNLITILVRFTQMSFGICKRFVFYSFEIGVRFAQNTIAICKRFVLFFIANIIAFAFRLIAIFIRFVRYLFRMNSTEN
jgi:hypothetical protein